MICTWLRSGSGLMWQMSTAIFPAVQINTPALCAWRTEITASVPSVLVSLLKLAILGDADPLLEERHFIFIKTKRMFPLLVPKGQYEKHYLSMKSRHLPLAWADCSGNSWTCVFKYVFPKWSRNKEKFTFSLMWRLKLDVKLASIFGDLCPPMAFLDVCRLLHPLCPLLIYAILISVCKPHPFDLQSTFPWFFYNIVFIQLKVNFSKTINIQLSFFSLKVRLKLWLYFGYHLLT